MNRNEKYIELKLQKKQHQKKLKFNRAKCEHTENGSLEKLI